MKRKGGSDKALQSDDLGDATLQEALDEDAKSSAGPGRQVFTAAELDVLENLSARRKVLEARSQELDIRENLLRAAQQSVEDKITDLKNIEKTIRVLLGEHTEQEGLKLRRLVRVYEAMKPKDSAKIFEELDIDIVVDVAELMEERRLAPVLANMDPVVAKEITTEIRTRRKLPELEKVDSLPENLVSDGVEEESDAPSG